MRVLDSFERDGCLYELVVDENGRHVFQVNGEPFDEMLARLALELGHDTPDDCGPKPSNN